MKHTRNVEKPLTINSSKSLGKRIPDAVSRSSRSEVEWDGASMVRPPASVIEPSLQQSRDLRIRR